MEAMGQVKNGSDKDFAIILRMGRRGEEGRVLTNAAAYQ
jgi:hypothetical protein